jgi:hypothetical protein
MVIRLMIAERLMRDSRSPGDMRRMLLRVSMIFIAGVPLCSWPASAQPPPPGQKLGLAANFQREYAAIKKDLLQAAETMPEADYGFRPSSMPEVRTFGQLFGHVANTQFSTCAAVKEVPNPNLGNDNEKTKVMKAEVVKALADSFAFCDEAYRSLTDANAHDLIKLAQGEIARAAALANNLAHNNEMYGTAGVYLRAKNIVPPSTDNAARGTGRGGGRVRQGVQP